MNFLYGIAHFILILINLLVLPQWKWLPFRDHRVKKLKMRHDKFLILPPIYFLWYYDTSVSHISEITAIRGISVIGHLRCLSERRTFTLTLIAIDDDSIWLFKIATHAVSTHDRQVLLHYTHVKSRANGNIVGGWSFPCQKNTRHSWLIYASLVIGAAILSEVDYRVTDGLCRLIQQCNAKAKHMAFHAMKNRYNIQAHLVIYINLIYKLPRRKMLLIPV